jgi:branched-chain amino acid transport system substrate-binding protein
VVVAAIATVGLALTPCSAASAAGAPIKIALITSETGIAASEFSTSPQGFLARVDLQNAQGGIDGRKIDPIVLDDQGSLTTVVTAVQQAISDHVTGIVSDTPFFFAAYKYAQEAGIPVTGGSFDGPEWGEQPNTNMFAADTGSVDPKYPVAVGIAKFLQQEGGTVLGSYGYGISPSSARSASGTAAAAKSLDMKVGVSDISVPVGSVAFTPEALAAKSAHVDSLYASMDNDSNFALLTALEQAGVKLKSAVFPTGYEQDIIHGTIWKAVQGDFFISEFRPFSLPDAGTKQMAAALEKYEHHGPSYFPTYNIYESYVGADLMIKGLLLAGKDATTAAVIKDLRSVTSYNADGLLPKVIDYATVFGKNGGDALCDWYMKAEKDGFVASTTAPICGTFLANSGGAS